MARAKRKNHHSTHHATSGHHSAHNHKARRGAGREELGRMQKSAPSAFDMFSGPMARIMDQNFSLFQKTVQTMHEESLRFFNRRLEHTSHIIENGRDFQGVSGLMQLQQEWMLELARDYSEQATRFAQLMRDLAVNSTEHFAEATDALENAIENEAEKYEEEGHRAAA